MAAVRSHNRQTAANARAVMLAIAGAFGEDVSATLQKLEE